MTTENPDLLIVGGGPAGMMAGLLFARAGVKTLVLEKHGDFLRDFRGDTVHPSTLELMDELGLLDEFLQRPHDEIRTLTGRVANEKITIADLSHLPVKTKFVAMMPQWDFLDFVADKAKLYPAFSLRLNAQAVDLIAEQGRIAGVKLADGSEIRPRLLTIAADGRSSVLREKSGLPLRDLGAPIDVLWFRLPKGASDFKETGGTFGSGTFIVQINRGDYWQCAFVVPKGAAAELERRGVEAFRNDVARAVPDLADVTGLESWEQVKLLSVSLDRLDHWSKPGLLCIGDAAHAMSPVGGVGINLAIQDAVAAANILAARLARGENVDAILEKVQDRRMLPVKLIQGGQKLVHDRILTPLVVRKAVLDEVPFVLKLFKWFPILRRIPARVVGLGFRREHIRSPEA
ncbi:FAD-dependent oxidoreductase [Allosphingosinicella sp.]|uniref:FAD-dependent oxidoreductase n=1 Tax=Allosphingosinicella sp. TaxID=2823234 RepID=UPI0037846DFF